MSGIITKDLPLEKCCCHSSTFILGNKDMHKSLDEIEFDLFQPLTTELAALEGLNT